MSRENQDRAERKKQARYMARTGLLPRDVALRIYERIKRQRLAKEAREARLVA